MKQASHTKPPVANRPRLLPELGLVDLADTTLEERLAGKLNEQLELFACRMRQGLLAASVAIGLEVMDELIEAEVTDLAGPKGRHDPDRSAYRHGTEAGKVTLGGRRVPVVRPRVRTVAEGENGEEHEVRLESYDTFAKLDLLADHTVECADGRAVGPALRGRPRARRPRDRKDGIGNQAVLGIRRFVTVTAERLAEFRTRPLDEQRWLICFIDGFDFAEHTMVGALGVTADGTKVPIGLVEGSTENATVVRGLVSSLRDRGLDATDGILFVLDGAKALHKAVRDVFGDNAVIARCRVHKERNVMDYLVEAERPWVRRKLRAAWANPNAARPRPPFGRSLPSSTR